MPNWPGRCCSLASLKRSRTTMAKIVADEVDLNGWDTVFAVTLDEINAAIRSRGSSPPKLNLPAWGADKFAVTADFGDWHLSPGGDGAEICVSLPMTNLVAKYQLPGKGGQPGETGEVTCDACTLTILIRLDLSPLDDSEATGPDGKPLAPPANGTKRHGLKPRTASTNPQDPVAALHGFALTKPLSDPQAKDTLATALLAWCNDNLNQFRHIFAVLDLETKVATGDFAFCKPHTSSYAYVDMPGQKTGYLGVLSMTSSDSVPSVQQTPAQAIPDGCGAAFLISRRRFLLDMVMPAVNRVWPIRTDQLELSSDAKTLRLKDGIEIHLPKAKDSNGTHRQPILKQFHVEIDESTFTLYAYTEAEVSAGIYATNSSTYYYEAYVGKNAKGEPALLYRQTKTPDKHESHRLDTWVEDVKTFMP